MEKTLINICSCSRHQIFINKTRICVLAVRHKVVLQTSTHAKENESASFLRVEDESSRLLPVCINCLFQEIINFCKQITLK